MIASQPGLILAAMGLVALVEAIVAAPRSRIRRAVPLVGRPRPGRRRCRSRSPRRGCWHRPGRSPSTPTSGSDPTASRTSPHCSTPTPPRPTVLTYEDWSSLAWYETGVGTVAVVPPGYAKLAFDPAVFTGHSQAERRSDLAAAFRGDPAVLVATADRYGADRIVLARRGPTIGLVSQPAAVAAAAGGVDRHHPASSRATAGMPSPSTRAPR